MHSSRPLRRLIAVFACLPVLLSPQVRTTAAPVRSALLEGDRGSGPALPSVRVPAATNGITWADVPKRYWARTAIDFVGATNDWMRDFRPNADGTYDFRPDQLESRGRFARSAVAALAPDELPDPSIHFPDLPDDDPRFTAANVAVKLGWMQIDDAGNFLPDDPITVRSVHRALVLALGLGEVAAGAQAIHMRDGTALTVPEDFGTLLVGMRLGLRYNHDDETLDVGPDSPLSRAEVAWSLYRAATEPTWVADSLAPYASIELPNLSERMQQVVEFGLQYVGYPYVWSGEWYQPTSVGYCCGSQPVGGFDCSGFAWWVLRAASTDWNPVPPRDYSGWALAERSSTDMARVGSKVRFKDLRPGDLMFYDGDDDGVVDHVDVYIGNGWSMDSGSSVGGVSLVRVDTGWYHDHFVHGRRIFS